MTIRPVDLQTMIPKIPEVQKAKNLETELQKNNLNINIHKEQQQQEKNTQKVVKTKETQESRINKDGRQKNKQGKQEKKQKESQTEDNYEKNNESKGKSLTRIDIRI
jgi:hypothetical protein